MSWQTYVDANLIGTNKITGAAIYGHDGGKWASSAGFELKPEEFKHLISGFKPNSELFGTGFYLAGVKYFTIKADERSVYGKKESSGCVCVKTGKALIIALYDENSTPGEVAKIAENLADYLISVSF
ncbi:profilin, required for normal timing of actin polymerization in response to thermal stress [Spiromyces aspiralis]|uniref:Profilin, required for normal timing of actin polymerization in response to thermal stress n=1 Tax=Spiromyces aspiralis TaxID=68401 RepID=A0ACC1HWA7_9FUNG|nr:profilin, required for normal timing of actin polymerization in response to thermal stress [Spiromyces aspiralis]